MSIPIATCKVREVHANIRKHHRHVLEDEGQSSGSEASLGSPSSMTTSLEASPQTSPTKTDDGSPKLMDKFRNVKDSLFGGIFGTGRSASLPAANLNLEFDQDKEEGNLASRLEQLCPGSSSRSMSFPDAKIQTSELTKTTSPLAKPDKLDSPRINTDN